LLVPALAAKIQSVSGFAAEAESSSQIRSAPALRNDRLLGSIPLTRYIVTYAFLEKVIPPVNAGVEGRELPELHHQYDKGFESSSYLKPCEAIGTFRT
jgi:hypothetical protein